MKKYIPVVLLIIVFGFGLLFFSTNYRHTEFDSVDNKLELNVKYKGVKGAKDFDIDNEGNCYIAFSNRVQFIDKNGKSMIIFEDKKLNIYSIVHNFNKLYFVSDCKLISYDLVKKTFTELINNLPNFGDYKESKLLIKGNTLLVSIGAATNSGVVGDDNLWLKSNPFQYDISPKTVTIRNGNNLKQKNGAFVPYNTKNIAGQIIPAHFPGNASVIGINIENSSSWLYAWGIRNVNGIDYNSEGKIFISTGGMEDRGARPVKGDVDYIYELKENTWYGWPDYSGGDPVNSPRFGVNNSEKTAFILDKHPTANPPAPVYQHKTLGSLGKIVIDKKGSLGEKDSIYFYETKDNKIYELNKIGLSKEKLKLGSSITIDSMKIYDKALYIMDTINGQVSVVTLKKHEGVVFSKSMGYYLLSIMGIVIISVMWKLKN
jgi:hypothetical protein